MRYKENNQHYSDQTGHKSRSNFWKAQRAIRKELWVIMKHDENKSPTIEYLIYQNAVNRLADIDD